MRWITLLLCVLSFGVLSDTRKDNNDLTQFDQPFLLGDWYLVNPSPDEGPDTFLAIKLSLGSNYTFSIDIQKQDYSIEHWEGLFTANDDTIILGLNSDEPQVYNYSGNHNMLNLNGVVFTKALLNALAGIWSSVSVSGDDKHAQEIARMDLILQPDFVFTFRVSSSDGDEAIHSGVYYTENDHIVLLYKDGEHDATYTLNQDELTLEVEDGDMFAVLNRIR
ncbi:hypothetical protein [Vibrio mediterranei]|uniref:hypothetical protein n=1 Tax=Vibrio mediterranei TaxID=689 RepID=UPI0040698808